MRAVSADLGGDCDGGGREDRSAIRRSLLAVPRRTASRRAMRDLKPFHRPPDRPAVLNDTPCQPQAAGVGQRGIPAGHEGLLNWCRCGDPHRTRMALPISRSSVRVAVTQTPVPGRSPRRVRPGQGPPIKSACRRAQTNANYPPAGTARRLWSRCRIDNLRAASGADGVSPSRSESAIGAK